MAKPKTKKAKSCASKRAYASGKKKGKCVPKGTKAKTRRGKKCYAETRNDAVTKLQLYNSTKAKRAEKQAKLAWDKEQQRQENEAKQGGISGLGRSRRRRRRSRR